MEIDWHLIEGHRPGEEYVQYAQVYDALFGDLSDDAELYLRLANEAGKGAEILEIGSGTGRLAILLLENGHRVVGVDASAEMLSVAATKLAKFGDRYAGHLLDVRSMKLGRRFPLVVAPYGMVAHLLTDDDRRRAFRTVFEHLEPGGLFVFDDMPGWLAGPSDATKLELRRQGVDAKTGAKVRLLANSLDVAGKPYTVRYDFLDWLAGDEIAKRVIVRVIFRNIGLAEETALLREAGFEDLTMFGDFDGRPLDLASPEKNHRLIFRCRKPA